MRLKKLASTDTRLTSRRTWRVLVNASWPKMRAEPPSWRSSVESRRTSVDFPDPLRPRIATHSPRETVNVTSFSAGSDRLRAKRPSVRTRRRNSLRSWRTSTAGTADLGTAKLMVAPWNERTGIEEVRADRRRAGLPVTAARVARAPTSRNRPGAAHHPIHVEQHGLTRIAISDGRAQSFARDYFG